jgi:hypothetical protein
MAINNLYWGATITELGGSYLNTKAIISVEEGYQVGASIHYVTLGDYEVASFNNQGLFRQQIQLELESQQERLKSNSSYVPRTFKSGVGYFDDFVDENKFSYDWSILSGEWGITNGTLISSHEGLVTDNFIDFIGSKPLKNFRIITKGLHTNNDLAGFEHRYSLLDNDNFTRSILYNGQMILSRDINGGTTTLSSVTFGSTTLADNNYWLMTTVNNRKIIISGATDGKTFTKFIDYTDNASQEGVFGLGVYSLRGNTFKFDSFEVQEIDNKYTRGDILTATNAMGGIFDTRIQSEYIGRSGLFEPTLGSSWVFGSSSDIYLVNTATGNSWHTYTMSGSSLTDFVAEIEIKGSSGNIAGIFVGNTNNFYGNYFQFNYSTNNFVEHYSPLRNTYTNYGLPVVLFPDQFYKLKMIKNNQQISWYVNDQWVNSLYGTSFNNPLAVDVGLMSHRNVSAGSTTVFKNFLISKLDELVEDIVFDSNQALSTIRSRYLPDGYASIWSGDHVEIFEAGASRGSVNLNANSNMINSDESIDNNTGSQLVIVRGQDNIARIQNANQRVMGRISDTNIAMFSEQDIQSKGDAISLANSQNFISNKNVQNFQITVQPRVQLEQFDTINYVDTTLGISRAMNVYNQVKMYNAVKGEFRQILTLF